MLDKLFDLINWIIDKIEGEWPDWWKDGGGPPYIGA